MCSKFRILIVCVIVFLFVVRTKAQVINYVSNGSFEEVLDTYSVNPFQAVKNWGAIDTSLGSYYLYTKLYPNNSVPYANLGFQFSKNGVNFISSQMYCTECFRGYPRNRLKEKLKANTTYCAKFYVVSPNSSYIAIDSYGMYFADSSIDTITKGNSPITYLNPQVQNQSGIISDTLNWISISGTFVATGDEKYLVLGNFKSNAATNTLSIYPTTATTVASLIYIDDVSVIELDLPAFAGHDYYLIPGDSVFIGREPDVGIDEACIWYQLPNMQTAIDTVAGFWVKPVVTTSYVVRQEICGNVKWDTVVIYQSALGIQDLKFNIQRLEIFPNPADDFLELKIEALTGSAEKLLEDLNHLSIYNSLGQIVREEEIVFKEKAVKISTSDLREGFICCS